MARPTFAKLAHQPKPQPTPAAAEQAAPASMEAGEDQPMLPMAAPKVQRSRQGKKGLTIYVAAELAKTVRLLSVKSERTLEDMATEAFNDLLRKYGEHPAG